MTSKQIADYPGTYLPEGYLLTTTNLPVTPWNVISLSWLMSPYLFSNLSGEKGNGGFLPANVLKEPTLECYEENNSTF